MEAVTEVLLCYLVVPYCGVQTALVSSIFFLLARWILVLMEKNQCVVFVAATADTVDVVLILMTVLSVIVQILKLRS